MAQAHTGSTRTIRTTMPGPFGTFNGRSPGWRIRSTKPGTALGLPSHARLFCFSHRDIGATGVTSLGMPDQTMRARSKADARPSAGSCATSGTSGVIIGSGHGGLPSPDSCRPVGARTHGLYGPCSPLGSRGPGQALPRRVLRAPSVATGLSSRLGPMKPVGCLSTALAAWPPGRQPGRCPVLDATALPTANWRARGLHARTS
jgi:hypothetical protein